MKLSLALLLAIASASAATPAPYLFQKPTMNRTQLVFVYAGDLWGVPRQGGDARRLTSRRRHRNRPGLLARRLPHRLHRRLRWQHRRLRRGGGRRNPKAPHLAPRPGHRAGLDARWQAHPLHITTHELLPLLRTIHRIEERRLRRKSPPADGFRSLVLARWQTPGLRSAVARIHRLEAISRRRNYADLAGQLSIPATSKNCRAPIRTTSTPCGSATSLLPVRPQRPGHAVLLRSEVEDK